MLDVVREILKEGKKHMEISSFAESMEELENEIEMRIKNTKSNRSHKTSMHNSPKSSR